MAADTSPLFAYADESCLGNQFVDRARPGGFGGLAEVFRGERGWIRRDFWGCEPDTTNNRMALRSGIELLAALRRPTRVVFTSDSRYLVDGMRRWVRGWMERGWRRKGGAIENLELWRRLVAEARRHEVDWRWVRGHAQHPQNEYAHALAVRAATTQQESGGLVASGFDAWIAEEQERRGRYLDFLPPPAPEGGFRPVRLPPEPGS